MNVVCGKSVEFIQTSNPLLCVDIKLFSNCLFFKLCAESECFLSSSSFLQTSIKFKLDDYDVILKPVRLLQFTGLHSIWLLWCQFTSNIFVSKLCIWMSYRPSPKLHHEFIGIFGWTFLWWQLFFLFNCQFFEHVPYIIHQDELECFLP